MRENDRVKLILGVTAAVLAVVIFVLIWMLRDSDKKYSKQLSIAESYLEEQKYDEALDAYAEAIDLEPKRPDAYIGQGNTFLSAADELSRNEEADQNENLKNYEQAAVSYEDALKRIQADDKERSSLYGSIVAVSMHLAKDYSLAGDVENSGKWMDNSKKYLSEWETNDSENDEVTVYTETMQQLEEQLGVTEEVPEVENADAEAAQEAEQADTRIPAGGSAVIDSDTVSLSYTYDPETKTMETTTDDYTPLLNMNSAPQPDLFLAACGSEVTDTFIFCNSDLILDGTIQKIHTHLDRSGGSIPDSDIELSFNVNEQHQLVSYTWYQTAYWAGEGVVDLTVSFQYDGNGRITGFTKEAGSRHMISGNGMAYIVSPYCTIEYQNDTDKKIAVLSEIIPYDQIENMVLNCSYDDEGRLISLSNGATFTYEDHSITENYQNGGYGISIIYDNEGRITEFSQKNGAHGSAKYEYMSGDTEEKTDLPEGDAEQKFTSYLNTKIIPERGVMNAQSFTIPYVSNQHGALIQGAANLQTGVIGYICIDLDLDGTKEMLVAYLEKVDLSESTLINEQYDIAMEVIRLEQGTVVSGGSITIAENVMFGNGFDQRFLIKQVSSGYEICADLFSGVYRAADGQKDGFLVYRYESGSLTHVIGQMVEGSSFDDQRLTEYAAYLKDAGIQKLTQTNSYSLPRVAEDEPDCINLFRIIGTDQDTGIAGTINLIELKAPEA